MNWKARWIWMEGEEKPRNFFLMCRKSFKLDGEIVSASLAITADSRYVLYVNGERIGQGPPRSFPWRQNYDLYDITPYLRNGENLIAVLVNHYGHSTFQYIQGRGGLLCQIEIETSAAKTVIGTDRTWKVKPSEAFARFVPRISVQQAWEEQFDARREPAGWTEGSFDDSDWENALEIGEPGCEPWTELVPRDIPLQTDDEVVPVRLMKAEVVRSIPYHWTVDLERSFFPDRYDSNHKSVRGFLLFEIRSEGENEVLLRRSHHVVGKLKLNGEEVSAGDGTRLHLRNGRNIMLFDVSGSYHLMQFSLGLECEGKLQAGRIAVIGPIRDDEMFNRIWESGDPEKTPEGIPIRDVPEEAIAKVDVWSLTYWDKPVVGVEPRVENLDAMLTPNDEWSVIHPSEEGDVRLLLDFGKELLAYTEFEIDAPEGTILDFNMFEGIQEGELLLTHGLNNSFRYVCREGRQSYRSYVKRGFRYAYVVLRNFSSPVRIRHITSRLSTYPTPERGEFYCDDDRLNRIWEIGAYTLRLCMDDTYLDCPAYEQTHWVGDARNEALINWAAFGDPRITAHCLLQTADSLRRSPLPESHVPSGWQDILTAWSLLWVISVREYWQFTGDRGFLERIYPAVKITCDNFIGYLNDDGLLEIEAWNMLDWAPMDTPRAGVVTHQNMLLVRSLREASEIADLLGKGDGERWRKAADDLKGAINRHLWSQEKGAFIDCIRPDGTPSPVISQQTNTMALLCDCVDGERARKVRELVLDPPEGVVTAGSPFFMFFLFEQLARDGEIGRMLDLTKEKWGFMIDKGATTFWETFPGWAGRRWTRSWCHAWSSAPTYFLSTEVLGVYPEEPGFQTVRIAPKPVGLNWCRGRFPTVQGEIDVEWRKGEEGFELVSHVPVRVKSHLILPAPHKARQVRINGEEVSPDRLPDGVESLEIKDREVELRLNRGGEWNIKLVC